MSKANDFLRGIQEMGDFISDKFYFNKLKDTPNFYEGYSGDYLVVDDNESGIHFTGIEKIAADLTDYGFGGGATYFTGIEDAPTGYQGHSGDYLVVNDGETGIHFTGIEKIANDLTDYGFIGGDGITGFTGLYDTPTGYQEHAGHYLVVNDGETGIHFTGIEKIAKDLTDYGLPVKPAIYAEQDLPIDASPYDGEIVNVGCDLYISCDGTWKPLVSTDTLPLSDDQKLLYPDCVETIGDSVAYTAYIDEVLADNSAAILQASLNGQTVDSILHEVCLFQSIEGSFGGSSSSTSSSDTVPDIDQCNWDTSNSLPKFESANRTFGTFDGGTIITARNWSFVADSERLLHSAWNPNTESYEEKGQFPWTDHVFRMSFNSIGNKVAFDTFIDKSQNENVNAFVFQYSSSTNSWTQVGPPIPTDDLDHLSINLNPEGTEVTTVSKIGSSTAVFRTFTFNGSSWALQETQEVSGCNFNASNGPYNSSFYEWSEDGNVFFYGRRDGQVFRKVDGQWQAPQYIAADCDLLMGNHLSPNGQYIVAILGCAGTNDYIATFEYQDGQYVRLTERDIHVPINSSNAPNALATKISNDGKSIAWVERGQVVVNTFKHNSILKFSIWSDSQQSYFTRTILDTDVAEDLKYGMPLRRNLSMFSFANIIAEVDIDCVNAYFGDDGGLSQSSSLSCGSVQIVDTGYKWGLIPTNQTITIRALPSAACTFDGWEGASVADPTALETTVTVTSSLSITAKFSVN